MNLGVIAARGGSKGFPRKNLALLAGKPLIAYSILAAKQSQLLDDYLVSTDDHEISNVAGNWGAPTPFYRPSELATDEISIWPTLLHATEWWENDTGKVADSVVLIQPTSPLRTAEDIDACISRFWTLNSDICASVKAAHDSPYFNMVEPVPDSPDLVRPCSPIMKRVSRRQDIPPVYVINGALYVVRRSLLSELNNQFEVKRYSVYEMPWDRSIDIDRPEDLKYAEWLVLSSQNP